MDQIQKIEQEIMKLSAQLADLRKENPAQEIKNYFFDDLEGKVSLLDLFGKKDHLIAVHNMGQGCRYCTLWADGLNPFIPHLEDRFAVILLSKDSPEQQRRFANSRGWRFRMASHSGGEYIQEQATGNDTKNGPGIICYERRGAKIFRKNSANFGPGDQFCSLWNILGLAGYGSGFGDWTPQFSYWKRPEKMDDGGQNLI